MKKWITLSLIACSSIIHGTTSCTDQFTYRDICHKAAVNDWVFQNFRSFPTYNIVVEAVNGSPFAEYLKNNASEHVLSKLDNFKKLDSFGRAPICNFKELGNFSGTTLRYIVIADHLLKSFQLPKKPKIVEIGAGFGGQCFVLSHLQPFSKYYIYDLPEPSELITKVLNQLEVEDVTCLPFEKDVPEKEIDLVISNYAFSECDRETQLNYFDRVIKKSKRGYMIYNQISSNFDIDSLTPTEFVDLLKKHKMHPKLENELIQTADKNVLITWDKSRKS